MVSLIDTTVMGCLAGRVRRVELAARALQRRTAAGRVIPLSSQPQSGGVVRALNSGAVSITRSNVIGCSAERVRQ